MPRGHLYGEYASWCTKSDMRWTGLASAGATLPGSACDTVSDPYPGLKLPFSVACIGHACRLCNVQSFVAWQSVI